jgi:hypothetical protein
MKDKTRRLNEQLLRFRFAEINLNLIGEHIREVPGIRVFNLTKRQKRCIAHVPR